MYILVFLSNVLLNRNTAVKQQDLANFMILKNYLVNPTEKKAKTRNIRVYRKGNKNFS